MGKEPNLAETRDQHPPSHFTERKNCFMAGEMMGMPRIVKLGSGQHSTQNPLNSVLVLFRTLFCFPHAFFWKRAILFQAPDLAAGFFLHKIRTYPKSEQGRPLDSASMPASCHEQSSALGINFRVKPGDPSLNGIVGQEVYLLGDLPGFLFCFPLLKILTL